MATVLDKVWGAILYISALPVPGFVFEFPCNVAWELRLAATSDAAAGREGLEELAFTFLSAVDTIDKLFEFLFLDLPLCYFWSDLDACWEAPDKGGTPLEYWVPGASASSAC